MGGIVEHNIPDIHNIQRTHTTLHQKKKKENNQKWAEDVNIPQIDIRMANRQKKMFNITNRQGIKTTVRCHFIPFRMAIIKKTNNRC